MQIVTVSGFWLCGRSWRFKIHFWRNIVYFRKSYICFNRLEVLETNLRFTQFNRIRNHILGRWIVVGQVSRSRFMGSDCSLSLEQRLRTMIERWDALSVTKFKDLKEWPMCWITLVVFPQTSSLRIKKLFWICLRTTKQWSRWSLKEGVPPRDRFPGPTESHLFVIRSNQFVSRNTKFFYTDTKNQLADMLPKGNFTLDEWNHLLCLYFQPFQFYSVLYNNGDTISTRLRRRTSHSKIATNDELHYKCAVARIILDFSKSGWEKLWKSRSLEYKFWEEERWARLDTSTDQFEDSGHYYHEQFLESFSSASRSKWDDDRAWSSEWKTIFETYERSGRLDKISCKMIRKVRPGVSREETLHDGTAQSVMNEVMRRDRPGRPDIDSQDGAWPQQFVIGNDETELELSVESRSFANLVNDQARIRQKPISKGIFMAVTMESAVIMRKTYLNNCQSIAGTRWFSHFNESSTYLQDWYLNKNEIYGVKAIGWENHSWKYLSWIGDQRVFNLRRTKVHVFSDFVLCLGKILENLQSNGHGKKIGMFEIFI